MTDAILPTRRKRTPRPRDRRAQILAIAGDLFYRHGFHGVKMSQIADEAGITPGALYRHYSSKQDLLAQALTTAFDLGADGVSHEKAPNLPEMVGSLVATAGARRDLGVLWSREARHLDPEHLEQMRDRFFDFVTRLVTQLRTLRPELGPSDADLIAWCALAVLTSPSYHSGRLGSERSAALIRRLTLTVCTTPLDHESDTDQPTTAPDTGIMPQSRRESILTAAARLFHSRGYQATSMHDIGAEVGISHAAVYKHFDSKGNLLSAVITRASAPLQLGLNHALATAATPAEALDNALDAYIDFALVHHDLLGILVSEVRNVPDEHQHTVRRDQHDYVAEWVRLLTGARPDLDHAEAVYVVHATLTTVNDATRTASLRERQSLGSDLRVIGRRLLAP
jgi:AcrR family transcriptional regulator